jgi:hypothetical protein
MHARSLHLSALAAAALLVSSCSPSFQGIRFRAEGPPIAEAYRSVTLAMTVDGYTLAAVDPAKFDAETGWRPLNPQEKPAALATTAQDGRLTLRMDQRGRMYDVYLLPAVRSVTGTDTVASPAPADHPFRLKWQRVLTTLLRKEQREED